MTGYCIKCCGFWYKTKIILDSYVDLHLLCPACIWCLHVWILFVGLPWVSYISSGLLWLLNVWPLCKPSASVCTGDADVCSSKGDYGEQEFFLLVHVC
jgi:hypothetical protein